MRFPVGLPLGLFLGADFNENGETTLRGKRYIKRGDLRVYHHFNSLFHDPRVFMKQVLIGSAMALKVGEVDLGVLELASSSVEAAALDEGLAVRHAILACHV